METSNEFFTLYENPYNYPVQPTQRHVRIYRDLGLQAQDLVEQETGKMNKDIIYYFQLPDIFPAGPHSGIVIHESIRRIDKRVKAVESPPNPHGVLHATVVDEYNTVMTPCHSCSSKQGVMLSVRSVDQRGRDAIVAVSVNCSGSPTSSSRSLRVRFEIRNYGGKNSPLAWIGDSTAFKLFHSRKRLPDSEEMPPSMKGRNELRIREEAAATQNILQQHQILKAPLKAPNYLLREGSHPAVTELYAHMMEVLSADSGVHLSEPGLHNAFLAAGRCMRTTPLLDTGGPIFRFLLPHLIEFMMSAADVNRVVYYRSSVENERAFFHLLAKMRDISFLMLSNYPTEWTEMLRLYWECITKTPPPEFEWCYCDTCMYAHIAFLVEEARTSGISKPRIAEMLNEANIPTKHRKKWHASLSGLKNKPRYFVLASRYTPDYWQGITRLSVDWVPPQRTMSALTRMVKTMHTIPEITSGQEQMHVARWLNDMNLESYDTMFEIEKPDPSPPIRISGDGEFLFY